jgi:hypothetical protein
LPAPAVTSTGVPIGDPPDVQSTAGGPQRKNVTFPVGEPAVALPVSVTVSVTDAPSFTVAADGDDLCAAAALPTAKHSPADPSLVGL